MSTTPVTLEETEERSETLPVIEDPSVEHLVTEDDTPVDNIFSEKQQRLLTEPLYTSWAGPGEKRSFLVLANVGLFYGLHEPPLVPDVLLSLDVQAPADPWPKSNRSYFLWEYGKPPEVVIEIVSNREGDEAGRKLEIYTRIGIPYYVIFDPLEQLDLEVLQVYQLAPLKEPVPVSPKALPGVGLGLTLWQGKFEGLEAQWLRWCDPAGHLIPTGAERAEHERRRAERLADQLRALGVEPEEEV